MCSENIPVSPMELALRRCDDLVAWYTKTARKFCIGHNVTQIAVILLRGLTPVLVVLQALSVGLKDFLAILIALLPATAAILTATSVAF